MIFERYKLRLINYFINILKLVSKVSAWLRGFQIWEFIFKKQTTFTLLRGSNSKKNSQWYKSGWFVKLFFVFSYQYDPEKNFWVLIFTFMEKEKKVSKYCSSFYTNFYTKAKTRTFPHQYTRCVARFGTVCTILKTWKTPMEEC